MPQRALSLVMNEEPVIPNAIIKAAEKKKAEREGKAREQAKAIREVQACNRTRKTNFYRILTHDLSGQRHNVINPLLLEKCCPLDNGHHDGEENVAAANSSSLGTLDKLPLELIHRILCNSMTLSILTRCRAVSRGLRMVIDNIPQYKSVMTHAPSSLRAIISLEAHRFTVLQTLYDALCSKECSTCGKFGAFLYILTSRRVCYHCFTTDTAYIPMEFSRSQFEDLLGIKDSRKSGIEIVRSIPGQYEELPKERERKRLSFITSYDAAMLGVIGHELPKKYPRLIRDRLLDQLQRLSDQILEWNATPEHERTGQPPPLPPFIGWNDREECNPQRFMCIVGFPWLNRRRGVVEWGVACNGCELTAADEKTMTSRERWRQIEQASTLHSEEEYIDHYTLCERARKIAKGREKEMFGRDILLERV